MKVASFFSGIGGIDLGFEKAGMDILFQCEILTFGQKILKKHWPGVKLHNDITKVTGDDVPDVDVFVGGFPCQDAKYLTFLNHGRNIGFQSWNGIKGTIGST